MNTQHYGYLLYQQVQEIVNSYPAHRQLFIRRELRATPGEYFAPWPRYLALLERALSLHHDKRISTEVLEEMEWRIAHPVLLPENVRSYGSGNWQQEAEVQQWNKAIEKQKYTQHTLEMSVV